jgi:hypothetical protein
MFANHQPTIAANARKSAEGFIKACVFVLSTIRVKLPQAVEATEHYLQTGERMPVAFFGSKLDGLDYLEAYGERLWRKCERIRVSMDGRELENALIDALLDIPGIGFAKAGFIAQLIYGVSGCIDTHNLVRFGIPARKFTPYIAGMTARNRAKHIAEYNSTVEQCGGTEQLWNDWCAYVSTNQGYGTAHEISAMHLVAA